jgi:hypothetical protein
MPTDNNTTNARPILTDPISLKNSIYTKIIEGISGKFPIVSNKYTAVLKEGYSV